MKKVLFAALLTVGMMAFSGMALAQEKKDAPETPAAPEAAAPAKEAKKLQVIEVAVYVLNLGKLDVSSGTFTADFYLSLKSTAPIAENNFEFLNGRASNVEKMEDTKQTEGGVEKYYKFYRILASLNTPIDLKRYPFDSQKMQIILEDKTKTSEEVVYVPFEKESGLDKAILFPGWLIKGWEAAVSEHEYPVYDEKFSQYVYTVDIARMPLNSFMKTFLPVIFLMLIVMASFILDPDKITTRLATISSALVASAMFHVSIAGQIPPVGYLTFADKFMVLTYLVLLLSFFLSLYVFVLQGRSDQARARKLHHISERLVFVVMPAIYVALFVFFR